MNLEALIDSMNDNIFFQDEEVYHYTPEEYELVPEINPLDPYSYNPIEAHRIAQVEDCPIKVLSPDVFRYISEFLDTRSFFAFRGTCPAIFGFLELHSDKRVITKANMELVSSDWKKIIDIQNPDEEVCWRAIRENPRSIILIPNSTEDMWIFALTERPDLLKECNTQTPKKCWSAIISFPPAIQWVKHQTWKMCEFVIEKEPNLIRFVRNKEKKLCMLALEKDASVLSFLEEVDDALIYKAIESDPYIIRKFPKLYGQEPSYRECLQAVRKDGMVLQHIGDQTFPWKNFTVVSEAISQNWRALQFVRSPWYESYGKCAIQQDWQALKFIMSHEQSEELCIMAVEKDYRALKYVAKQTKEICKAAIQKDQRAKKFVTIPGL